MAKEAKKRKPTSQVWEVLKGSVHSPSAKLGAILLIVLVFSCVFANLIAPYGVNELNMDIV